MFLHFKIWTFQHKQLLLPSYIVDSLSFMTFGGPYFFYKYTPFVRYHCRLILVKKNITNFPPNKNKKGHDLKKPVLKISIALLTNHFPQVTELA